MQYGHFSKRVRNEILKAIYLERPCLEALAQQFAMSKRTFQRKLQKEGNSYRKILENLRSALAYELKDGLDYPTKDLAYLLGYSSASAYLHACKNW